MPSASEKIRAEEMKFNRYCECGHRCEVCDKFMTYANAQISHRIPQHKKYIKKYGKSVIHHPLNWALTCSLKCNGAVLMDPATHPSEAEVLVVKIKEDLNG